MPRLMWVGFGSAILLALICALVYALNERTGVAEATLSEVDTIVGVDADIDDNNDDTPDNTATSLGAIDRCISVNSTDVFYIDLFVKGVADLNDWQGTFSYDESVVDINSLDVDGFFLGSSLWGPTFYCYEDPVGDEGECTLGTFDTTYAGHDGSGVLGRLEITALSAGTSKLYFTLWRPPTGVSGIELKDSSNPPAAIGDLDDDLFFDGLVFNAIVVVDEPCEADADLDGFTNVEESVDGSDLLNADSTPEMCDDTDNDLDGLTDEWYDRDPVNGTPDCVDPDSNTDGTGDANPIDTDDDDDGFSDVIEAHLGSDSLADCAQTVYHSAWPLDTNNDTFVTVVPDVLSFRGLIGSTYGDGNFRKRLDFNGDYYLTIVPDVLAFRGHIGEGCS